MTRAVAGKSHSIFLTNILVTCLWEFFLYMNYKACTKIHFYDKDWCMLIRSEVVLYLLRINMQKSLIKKECPCMCCWWQFHFSHSLHKVLILELTFEILWSKCNKNFLWNLISFSDLESKRVVMFAQRSLTQTQC